MATVTVSFSPTTTFEDGTPVVGLLGYKIYKSDTSGVPGSLLHVNAAGTTSYSFNTTLTNTQYITVTSYTANSESAPSPEVSFNIVKKPSTPGGVTVVVS